jgi:hypothetical protein
MTPSDADIRQVIESTDPQSGNVIRIDRLTAIDGTALIAIIVVPEMGRARGGLIRERAQPGGEVNATTGSGGMHITDVSGDVDLRRIRRRRRENVAARFRWRPAPIDRGGAQASVGDVSTGRADC